LEIKYYENILTADDYLALESKVGDAITSKEQASRAIENQLFSMTAKRGGEVIGSARLVGDGAIYYYINDVWVLPEFQGKGIGTKLVEGLIKHVKATSIRSTSVCICLMSAKGKEGFYEKLGFLQRPHDWEGAGMEMELDIDSE